MANDSKKKLKSYQDYGSPLIENLADDSKIYLSSADAKRSKLNANQVLFEDSINSKYAKFKPINGHRWKEKKITRNFEAEPSINVLKHPYGLYNTDANFNHNPVKKSASKRMKFPFFFHSKNETQKLKNNKKRKLFCFNCDKKDKKVMKSSTPQQIQKDPGKKKFPEQEIIENILDKKISEHLRNSLKVNREKREDWTANRERQLKEIEELEKKINRVEIHTSGLQKR
ncbi:unnamed protein product [Diatraea saccharalis]|uniref:Uncharacterized protein n=1 Tax=Diatraea saccharalis TaxID=40085 RepID=A0A9N9WBR9_9NEOP|nr:unnamed protein product [Diatraea saccharalis]